MFRNYRVSSGSGTSPSGTASGQTDHMVSWQSESPGVTMDIPTPGCCVPLNQARYREGEREWMYEFEESTAGRAPRLRRRPFVGHGLRDVYTLG